MAGGQTSFLDSGFLKLEYLSVLREILQGSFVLVVVKGFESPASFLLSGDFNMKSFSGEAVKWCPLISVGLIHRHLY